MLAQAKKSWDIVVAVAVGSALALWIEPSVIDRVTTELITFFGIQSAVILPAMILTAGILRPDGLSLPEARRYRSALREQMIFWVVLLALDFLTVALLIVGKAVAWKPIVPVPWNELSFNASAALVWVASALGTLALLRTIPFVKGVMSLQNVNADLTESAIRTRDADKADAQEKRMAAQPFNPPDGYGRIANRH